MGVRFKFQSEVSRITISGKTATSCILKDSTEIACDLIFSNADSAETVLKLLPAEAVPPVERYRQRSTEPSSSRSEEHTSELQSRGHLVCRLLLEKKNI